MIDDVEFSGEIFHPLVRPACYFIDAREMGV